MKEYTITCTGLASAEELYALLERTLDFPDSYSYDPDALYDCLVAISQETRITIYGLDTLAFAEEFNSIFQNAESDNFWLTINLM